jgi:hypothetical protein
MDRTGLWVVPGGAAGAAVEAVGLAPDPVAPQEECLRAFLAGVCGLASGVRLTPVTAR